jgi:hypothetical protein
VAGLEKAVQVYTPAGVKTQIKPLLYNIAKATNPKRRKELTYVAEIVLSGAR